MKTPKTLHELNFALANIMAGAISGDVKEREGRLALNAATRIIESVQAETRIRALAFATKQKVPSSVPLNGPIWSDGSAAAGPDSLSA